MTWTFRVLPAACAALLAASACGGPTDQDSIGGDGTPLTVFVPLGPGTTSGDRLGFNTTTVEYRMGCRDASAGSEREYELTDEGALERTGEFDGGPEKGVTSVWKGFLSPEEGECLLDLRARDDDGEVICVHSEPVSPLSEPAVERLVELPCYNYVNCTTTPLPHDAPKSFCQSVVGVLLTVETPAALQSLRGVRYAMREVSFLENDESFIAIIEGDLAHVDSTESDFGNGLEPAERWSTGIEDVPVGQYAVTFTALGFDDAPACEAEREVSIVADAVAQIEFSLPCRNVDGGAP